MALADSSRAYLQSVFALNPLEHADEIARRRRERRGLPVRQVAAAELVHEAREWAAGEITALRAEFTSLSAEALAHRLSDARLAAFPDVALACARLRTYAECKPRLAELEQRGAIDMAFARLLELLIVLPTGPASRLRQDLLRGLPTTNDTLRANEHGIVIQARVARRAALRIARAAPQVYALEREWLETLCAIPGQWARWRNRWHRRRLLWFLLALYFVVRAVALLKSGS